MSAKFKVGDKVRILPAAATTNTEWLQAIGVGEGVGTIAKVIDEQEVTMADGTKAMRLAHVEVLYEITFPGVQGDVELEEGELVEATAIDQLGDLA